MYCSTTPASASKTDPPPPPCLPQPWGGGDSFEGVTNSQPSVAPPGGSLDVRFWILLGFQTSTSDFLGPWLNQNPVLEFFLGFFCGPRSYPDGKHRMHQVLLPHCFGIFFGGCNSGCDSPLVGITSRYPPPRQSENRTESNKGGVLAAGRWWFWTLLRGA